MGCGAVSYSNVTIHTPKTSTVSIEQLSRSGDFEVYYDVSAEVDVEVFRGVVGQNGKLLHCGDYVLLSYEHHEVIFLHMVCNWTLEFLIRRAMRALHIRILRLVHNISRCDMSQE